MWRKFSEMRAVILFWAILERRWMPDSYSRLAFFVPILILGAFVFLEISSFSETRHPIRFGDTKVFERVSRSDVSSLDFYTNGRTFFTPLIYKILDKDKTAVFVFQSAASVLCWFFFGLVVAREIKNRFLRYALWAAICLYSLAIPINQWDGVLLSESLSVSVTLLTFGLSLVLAKQIGAGCSGLKNWVLFLVWTLSCFFLCGTKDTNIYIIWLLALLLIVWGIVGLGFGAYRKRRLSEAVKRHNQLPAAVAVLLILGVFGNWTMSKSVRWQTPLLNVILARVLTNDSVYERWASSYQLPRNPKVERKRGRKAWDSYNKKRNIRDEMKRDNSELQDVYVWLLSKGMKSYQHYLLCDNLWGALKDAQEAFEQEVNETNDSYGKGISGVSAWTTALSPYIYPRIPNPSLWFVLILVWCLLSAAFSRDNLLPWTVAVISAAVCIQAFVGYHGDAAEVSRHMFMAGILFRLALLIGFAGLASDTIKAAYWIRNVRSRRAEGQDKTEMDVGRSLGCVDGDVLGYQWDGDKIITNQD